MNKSKTKGGLGRGLSALIPQVASGGRMEEEPAKDGGEVSIEIKKITANPYQPRRAFDEEKLQELTESIKEHGVFQPILVRVKDEGYELIAGERRLRAAGRAGLKTIPAVVRDLTDEKMMEFAIIENIQRQDLNPVEEARAYKRLADEFKMTQDQIAKRLSKSRPYIANSMRLLNLPEAVLGLLAAGQLTVGHVRPLLTLSEDQAVQIARQLAEQKATVREAELWARRAGDPDFFKAGSLEGIFRNDEEELPADEEGRPAEEKAERPVASPGYGNLASGTFPAPETGEERTGQAFGPAREQSKGTEKKELPLPVELREIQRVLREKINTKVEITAGAKGGKIIIDYYTQDDLERILDLFAGIKQID